MSAGVPHDTLTERRLAEIKWWAEGDPRGLVPNQAREYLLELLAELARVSREHDELGRRYDALRGAYAREAALAREHETMRDALRIAREAIESCDGRCGFAYAEVLAGSRAATPDGGCPAKFEFGDTSCDRPAGHPGPHRNGPMRAWFNDAGQRVHGASAEDYPSSRAATPEDA